MKLFRSQFGRSRGGFTLVELMVGVALTTVIIFALYNIFNQTQRALRANVAQTDVMESGRAAEQLIARELEQIAPANFWQTNLYAAIPPVLQPPTLPLQVLLENDNKTPFATNVLQEVFFLSQVTNHWLGTGYRVVGANLGVGSLYRFSVGTTKRGLRSENLLNRFFLEPIPLATNIISTNWARVLDGVVHFRIAAFDADGRRLGIETTNMPQGLKIVRSGRPVFSNASTAPGAPNPPNLVLQGENIPNQTRLAFTSNAVPAFIDLELGILEPQALQQYKAMREGPAQLAVEFLRKQAPKVHYFRERIPVRTSVQ